MEELRINLKGLNILIAEDNEDNAEIIMEILESEGISTELAKDGDECVDMLKAHEAGYYDMILMDIQMPRLNGVEAAKIIRAMSDERKAEIPIIAVTANAFSEDKLMSKKAGMNGHISKPVIPEELFSNISKCCKRN